MIEDEIILEIHRYREEFAKAHNYDIEAIAEAARERTRLSGVKVVDLSQKTEERSNLDGPSNVPAR